MNKTPFSLYYKNFNVALLCAIWPFILQSQKGVVVVPVTDLFGSPQQTLFPTALAVDYYRDCVTCSYQANSTATCHLLCPRLHQLLFNEQVDLIDTTHDIANANHTNTGASNHHTGHNNNTEINIHIPNFFYLTNNNSTKNADYWTTKKSIIAHDALVKKGINLSHFPQPISFDNPDLKTCNHNTVTLTLPFTDRATQRTFSVGTRFVRASTQKTTMPHLSKKKSGTPKSSPNNKRKTPRATVTVYAFNPDTITMQLVDIPMTHCFIDGSFTKQQRINNLISVLKNWAHLKNGFIPYVWGGCSFTSCQRGPFEKREKKIENGTGAFFTYPHNNASPASGFDCSGLIGRAAQLCGIPYFFKNTTTLAHQLTAVAPDEKLADGDLIFIPGHVMIISSLQENLVIEARGYPDGFGKVQELPIRNIFKNINTYGDLLSAYKQKKPLERLNKNKEISLLIPEFKLLKLNTVWSS